MYSATPEKKVPPPPVVSPAMELATPVRVAAKGGVPPTPPTQPGVGLPLRVGCALALPVGELEGVPPGVASTLCVALLEGVLLWLEVGICVPLPVPLLLKLSDGLEEGVGVSDGVGDAPSDREAEGVTLADCVGVPVLESVGGGGVYAQVRLYGPAPPICVPATTT